MKKRLFFILLFTLAAVCFSSLNDNNNPKACSTNNAHCTAIGKKPVKNKSSDYVEYAEPVFIHLMNPVISM